MSQSMETIEDSLHDRFFSIPATFLHPDPYRCFDHSLILIAPFISLRKIAARSFNITISVLACHTSLIPIARTIASNTIIT